MKWSHENKKSEASILVNIKTAVFDGEIGVTTSMSFKRFVLPFWEDRSDLHFRPHRRRLPIQP
jgi:hypothetical protein